jgi:Fe-S-cluster containining protein
MRKELQLPDFVRQLAATDSFQFSCHQGVPCFTECCRLLELSLTPYDVLRLRHGTNKSSRELLDNFIIVEHEQAEPFPRFYLTMVDDGRASCVFVSKDGCAVYPHRPSACRSYPLGRAVQSSDSGNITEQFVLVQEPHCKGFQQTSQQNLASYTETQHLQRYNEFNDALAVILQHDAIRKGFLPSGKQLEHFILGLYDLDTFRAQLLADQIGSINLTDQQRADLADDETLLAFSLDWVYGQLFNERPPADWLSSLKFPSKKRI